jgi:hypothetical protein
VQLFRRLHLYAGLLMLPWVLLYGVTGFLFNHPNVLADQPVVVFSKSDLEGTEIATPPVPAELATEVAQALQASSPTGTEYTVVQPEAAQWSRDFVFATVKATNAEVSLLWDLPNASSTLRLRTIPAARPAAEKAPFARGSAPRPTVGRTERAGERPERPSSDALKLPNGLHERLAAAIPGLLTRAGFPSGVATVTSVPDLLFRMADNTGRIWQVTYNAQTGSVAGRAWDSAPEPSATELSVRRFLLRLHTAHGYPSGWNARWVWAVIVDLMAGIMVFWAVSGVMMWWQIKATRRVGVLLLLISGLAATAVGIGMHELLSMGNR